MWSWLSQGLKKDWIAQLIEVKDLMELKGKFKFYVKDKILSQKLIY